MKVDVPSLLRSNRKVLALVVGVVVIIVVAVYALPTLVDLDEPGPVDAVITVDEKVSRLGDGVALDASASKGDVEGYLWDLGDGNTSTNASLVHHYSVPGWYTVNLTVLGRGDRRSNASVVVGVQQVDAVVDRELDQLVWLSSGMMGSMVALETGPNVGNPTIDLEVHLEGAVGNIGYTLWVDEHPDHRQLTQESFTATGGDLDITRRFEAWDLPIEMQSNDHDLEITVWIDEGKWRSGTVHVVVTFPLDNVVPP